MIISATLHTLFSADAEGHFGFYYFMRKAARSAPDGMDQAQK